MAKRIRQPSAPRRAVILKLLSTGHIKNEDARNASTILEYTYKSAKALLQAYELARRQRGASRGMTTDSEQDILRAMLVIAAAGLDGMAKQLIRDTLPTLVHKDKATQEGLERFIARQLRGDPEAPAPAASTRFLARVLAADSRQRAVIEEYIRELTGGSLQSADELIRVAAAFGLEPRDVGIDPKRVKDIFDVRNKIIHELDVDLSGARRKRNLRRQQAMVRDTDTILEIGLKLVSKVDSKLSQCC